jgi:hypothetical protein
MIKKHRYNVSLNPERVKEFKKRFPDKPLSHFFDDCILKALGYKTIDIMERIK